MRKVNQITYDLIKSVYAIPKDAYVGEILNIIKCDPPDFASLMGFNKNATITYHKIKVR